MRYALPSALLAAACSACASAPTRQYPKPLGADAYARTRGAPSSGTPSRVEVPVVARTTPSVKTERPGSTRPKPAKTCGFLRHDGDVWVTPRFPLSAFHSKDGTQVPRKLYDDVCFLALTLEVVQAEVGVELHVNSAYRSHAHNETIRGASSTSRHLVGRAVDADGKIHPKTLARAFERLMKAGRIPRGWVKAYNGHVHYHLDDDVDVTSTFPGAAPVAIACTGRLETGLRC